MSTTTRPVKSPARANKRGEVYKEIPKHRILRETLRHFIEFREVVQGYGSAGDGADGRKGVLEHTYWAEDSKGKLKKVDVSISFWDLQIGLAELAPRKREAIWLNVIEDKKQKDVAKIMKITTVSVGQYVEAGMIQLAKRYFAEDSDE